MELEQILDLFKAESNGINKHNEGYTISKFYKNRYIVIFILKDVYKNCIISKAKNEGYIYFTFKLSYILSIIRKRKINLLRSKIFQNYE